MKNDFQYMLWGKTLETSNYDLTKLGSNLLPERVERGHEIL